MLVIRTMNIYYLDEEGNTMHALHDVSAIPNSGESVVINNEELFVKDRVFHPQQNAVAITLGLEGPRKKNTPVKDNGRLTEVKNSIIKLTSRQGATEKKIRAATDQLENVRNHANAQTQKDSKK